MEDWKCEWDTNCSNKATEELQREDHSKPPIMADSFGAGFALPPMPQREYLKVCEAHLSEASLSFFQGVGGWTRSLETNQIKFTKPVTAKKCKLCQTVYPVSFINYCLNDGSVLEPY